MKVPGIFSSNSLRAYAMVVTVNLSVVTTGITLAWPSPMLVKLTDPSQTHLQRPVTTQEGSWIVAIGFLISTFSNVPTGYLLDVIGRKWSLILTAVPKLCGCVLLLYGREAWVLILARAVILVFDGMVFIVVPIYASEIASKEQRGALCTFLQVFCSVGFVITFSVGPFVSYNSFNIIYTVLIAASALPLLFLPDSPYHVYSKGRISEASQILSSLRNSEEDVKYEIEEYAKSKKEVKIDKISLLTNKMFLKSVGIAFLVSGGSQLIGYNGVSYYMQTILESTKTSVRSEIASVIIGIIQLVASLCTALITDRYGRRIVLIVSLCGVLVGMMGLGWFFQISQDPKYNVHGFMNYLPTASLIIIVFCYSAGVGSLTWAITAELFEGPARAYGVSIVLAFTMLMVFIVTKCFPLLTLAIGPAATYWLLSVNSAIITTLIFLFVPETKGKSFSEIQKDLVGRVIYIKNKIVEKQDLENA